jgi:hypothetical protein
MIDFFEEDGWEFDHIDDMPVVRLGFSGEHGRWLCYAQAREMQQQFVFYSVMPITAPPEKRMTVAEYITRANYGMVIGNFEMDFEDGEIRYKTSIDVEGSDITTELIQQCVYANVVISDRYLPGLMRVIYGGIDPEVALYELDVNEMNAMQAAMSESDFADDMPDPQDDAYDDTFGYLDDYDDLPDENSNGFNPGDLPGHLSRFSGGDNSDDSGDNPDGLWN